MINVFVLATPDGIPLDTIGEKKPEGGVPPAGKPPGPGEMKPLMTGAKLALLFIGIYHPSHPFPHHIPINRFVSLRDINNHSLRNDYVH